MRAFFLSGRLVFTMKIFKFVVCIFIFFFTSCTNFEGLRQEDDISNHIIKVVSKRLNEKYGFKLASIGGGADQEGVWNLDGGYSLNGAKILDIKVARELILNCMQEFLYEANNNEEFRPFMKVYPFTPKNITIVIFNHDEEGRRVHFPYISVVSISRGTIDYRWLGPTIMDPYAQEVSETYEEALKLSGRIEPNSEAE